MNNLTGPEKEARRKRRMEARMAEKQREIDEWHMNCALHLASSAAAEGEVPVGAVLLAPNGTVLARAHNMVARTSDPTAHAELLAVRQAASL